MANNVLLTTKGMDFVTSAHADGVYIDLRYFVPVYDDRIDPTVRTSGYNLSSFNQVADRNVTTPIGEILWRRTNSYTLHNSNQYIISATGATWTGTELQRSYQGKAVYTNLYGGQPISDQISASSWNFSGSNGVYNIISNGAGTTVTGLGNARPTGTSSDWYFTQDYYPVYDTAAAGSTRGAWKCLLHQNGIGNVKFNKILLYAVAVQAASQTATSRTPIEECLFAESYIESPIILSNLGIGYNAVEIDVQIDISGTSADFNNLFFSSSADYWSHSPGGLYYPGKIGVGMFEDNQRAISASMHLRKPRDDYGQVETTVPILRLDYDNNNYATIDVNAVADIVIGNTSAIYPAIASSIVIGTSTYPFKQIVVTNTSADYAINVNNSSVRIGNSQGANQPVSADPYGIKLSGIGVNILDDIEYYGSTFVGYGNYVGGDLLRKGQNLLIYTKVDRYGSCGSGWTDLGSKNIYLFAGLRDNTSYTSVYGQTGPTHKNIVYEIETVSSKLFSGTNTKLSTTAELHLAAKGKIGLHGPIEIQNLSEYAIGSSLANAILISRSPEEKMLIGVGLNSSATFNTLTDRIKIPDTLADLRPLNTSLILAAGNIWVDGSVYPIEDRTHDLGSENNYYYNIYAYKANLDKIDATYGAIDKIFSDQVYSTNGYWEANRPFGVGKWSERNSTPYYTTANDGTWLKDLYDNVNGNRSLGLTANSFILVFSTTTTAGPKQYFSPLSKLDRLDVGILQGLRELLQSPSYSPNVSLNADGRIKIEGIGWNYLTVRIDGQTTPVIDFPATNNALGYSSQYLYTYISIAQSYSKVGDIFFVNGSFTGTGVNTFSISLTGELERSDSNGFFRGDVVDGNNKVINNSYIYSSSSTQAIAYISGEFTQGVTYYYNLIYRGKTGI